MQFNVARLNLNPVGIQGPRGPLLELRNSGSLAEWRVAGTVDPWNQLYDLGLLAAMPTVAADTTMSFGTGGDYDPASFGGDHTAAMNQMLADARKKTFVDGKTLKLRMLSGIWGPFAKQHRYNFKGATNLLIEAEPWVTLANPPTGAQVVSGSAGNWLVEFDLTAHGVAVGNYVFVDILIGTGAYKEYEGAFKVAEVPNANKFRVVCKSRNAAIATSSFSAGRVRRMLTIFRYNGATTLFDSAEGFPRIDASSDPGAIDPTCRSIRIAHLGLDYEGSFADSNGFVLREPVATFLDRCVAMNFKGVGIWCLNNAYGLVSSGGFFGNEAEGAAVSVDGHLGLRDAICNHNLGGGARCRSQGGIAATRAVFAGNGSSGLSAEDSGRFYATSTYSYNNVISGYRVDKVATGQVLSAPTENGSPVNAAKGNLSYGYESKEGGRLFVASPVPVAASGVLASARIDRGDIFGGAAFDTISATYGRLNNDLWASGVMERTASSNPEGSVFAPLGSRSWNPNGAPGARLYFKTTGVESNTGWVTIL